MPHFVIEERRPKIESMRARDLFNELVEDAGIWNHATAWGRLTPALLYIAKKWRKRPEDVMIALCDEVMEKYGKPLPIAEPIDMNELLKGGI